MPERRWLLDGPLPALRALVQNSPLLVGLWCYLLAVLLVAPWLSSSPDPGNDLTRNTVRLALLYYLFAALLMLRLGARGWHGGASKRARLCWSLACCAYLIHVGLAFHYFHRWSHAEAVMHVERRSGFGPGIFFSYLFTVAWMADVLWWWLWPRSYADRSGLVDWLLHGYLAFIIFNSTVVYETGIIRWAGVLLFGVLGLCFWARLTRRPLLRGEQL